MVFDPALGYDPLDPTATVAGRHAAAGLGINTLGASQIATLNGVPTNTTTHQPASAQEILYDTIARNSASNNPYNPQTAQQTAAANAVANEYARQFDLQYKLSKQQLDNNYQIAARNARTAEERNRIDQQYNQAQIQLAQQRLAQDQTQYIISQSGHLPNGDPTLSLQQLQAQNEATEGQLTGIYKNQPTLANQAQQANFLGMYNGQETQQAQQQAFEQGYQTTGQMGYDANGNPTAATSQFNTTSSGYDPNGNPTLANRQFQTGASGYMPNGQATLSREQAAANTALQAGQLGASLQGPSKWPAFLQAQYGIAGSPASSLVSSVPGGLGAPAGPNPAPMTLGTVLNGFGVMPQTGQGQPNYQMPQQGQPVYAGGTPGFNEATGQYTQPQQPQGGGGSPWYTTGGGSQSGASGRSNDAASLGADVLSGGRVTANEQGAGQPGFLQGYAPYNLMGAIGQVANAPRLTSADFGLSDQEGNTIQGYMNDPNSAPTGWWESKSDPQRQFLQGFNSYGGGDQATFLSKYRDSRPRQMAWNAA